MKDVLSDEKKNTLVKHLGFYGPLLTENQREMTQMYVDDDLSLSEIAAQFGITRQGVCDTIRKAGKTMESYEEKLKLMARSEEIVLLITHAMDCAGRILCTEETFPFKDSVIKDLSLLLSKEETDYGI